MGAPDSQTAGIVERILSALPRDGREVAVFMDFDGTIIDGDITEGQAPGPGRPGYVGLAEAAIRAGFAHQFSGDDGYRDFLVRYEEGVARDPVEAYVWMSGLFCDLPPDRAAGLERLVERHFRQVLAPHLFRSSVEVIRRLTAADVPVTVISASPHVFVQGARHVLPEIPPARLFGIDRSRDARGRLRDPIVNHGEGKTLRLARLVAGRRVQVLAGFGNSWSTDGHFLRAVVNRWRGLGVMINGGPAPTPAPGVLEVLQESRIGP